MNYFIIATPIRFQVFDIIDPNLKKPDLREVFDFQSNPKGYGNYISFTTNGSEIKWEEICSLLYNNDLEAVSLGEGLLDKLKDDSRDMEKR